MIRTGKTFWWYTLVFGLAAVLAGCGGGEPAAEEETTTAASSFVGTVEGSEAFIGLVREGENVMAYVCDGDSTSAWFVGQAAGDGITATSKGGAQLAATFGENEVTGTFTPAGGAALSFTANAATPPAGLYRAEETFEEQEHVGGWIVLPDGRQKGLIVKIADGTSNTIVGGFELNVAGSAAGSQAVTTDLGVFNAQLVNTLLPYIEQDN
jgi:hypothetical protein